MGRRGVAAWAVYAALALWAPAARAQEPASQPENQTPAEQANTPPITYDTSYNRDVSTATWMQTLSYALNRGPMSLSASGNNVTTEFPRSPGLGGKNGSIAGALNYHAARNWTLSLNGDYNLADSKDPASETSKRQNRLKISSQYSVSPWRAMNLQGTVSSELQRDDGLTVRPLGQEQLRLLPRYNSAGDSVGVDSIFVHDHRDSTYMSGRQDGASVHMDWKIK